MRELPVELSKKEVCELFTSLNQMGQRDVFFEMNVYGRLPVMQSAQCLKKTVGCCNKTSEQLYLKDGKGRKLPVTTHCRDCYNLIWQDKPGSLIGEDLQGTTGYVKRHRFDLFHLEAKEIENMKFAYLHCKEQGFLADDKKEETNHHWNYGIE